jgi:hypothetical protein
MLKVFNVGKMRNYRFVHGSYSIVIVEQSSRNTNYHQWYPCLKQMKVCYKKNIEQILRKSYYVKVERGERFATKAYIITNVFLECGNYWLQFHIICCLKYVIYVILAFLCKAELKNTLEDAL